nr:ribonuclease H-like domain-containing protein [Tanacetum cinerariifolium]
MTPNSRSLHVSKNWVVILPASSFPLKVTTIKAPKVNAVKGVQGNWHALKDKRVIDSGCSRHMTGNMSYFTDFKEINGGYVSFGGNPKGGKITDTECIVLSPEFKLPDENEVLLRVPRENNMYNVDLKNIVPSGDLTCLFAKETLDESNLWHRRLGHINFKTMNKLVKGNLVNLMGRLMRDFSLDTLSKDPHNTDGNATFEVKEPEFEVEKPESEVHVSPSSSAKTKKHDDKTKREAKGKTPVDTNTFSAASPSNIAVSPTLEESSYVDPSQYPNDLNMPALEDITYSDDDEDVVAEADLTNLETTITVSPIPTTRIRKDHHVTQIIGDLSSATQTRSITRMLKDQGRLTQINNEDFHTCMFVCFLLQEEPKREEGIDYEEVFAPAERIEVIRLFLGYASFMGFMVYQMDEKSSFLYETIEEEVYVCQPLGFEDPDYPDKVNDVIPLQAIIDKKKVIITEDTVRQALRLDDAESIDCLPNEKIFTELARMGSSMASAVICLATGGCIQTEGTIANLDADKDVALQEVDVEKNDEVEKVADVQGRLQMLEESQATVYHIDLEHVDKVLKPKPLKKQARIEQDEAYARELEAELNRNINWDDVIEHVNKKEKQDNMDYFKGMSYDDIRPIFEKYFNSNVAFLEKSKEELEEEESIALKRKTESSEEKAVKKQKLDEEVEELKKHLQIMPNDDDDVYTEATPLALKVPVIDYEIHTEHNKPYYKIIRADGSHQLFLSFLSLLRNFNREDLEILWQLV